MVELTSSFELEFEALDQDHRKMIDRVNAIIKEIDTGNTDVCETLVAGFVDFSKQHFGREEALLVSIKYPDVEKHRKHHRDLYDKLDHMLEFAKMAPENDIACESLKKELVYFIMDDVITADLEFKDFLSKS
ncbi:MAG: hemerythrin family protein [Rhodospirillales bacterium]|nr:hemerythrin family protein [Rhodospirillales bacterium]